MCGPVFFFFPHATVQDLRFSHDLLLSLTKGSGRGHIHCRQMAEEDLYGDLDTSVDALKIKGVSLGE